MFHLSLTNNPAISSSRFRLGLTRRLFSRIERSASGALRSGADDAAQPAQTLPAMCDLVIVGAGAAGLTAAITAKKSGLDVVVLEKEPWIGGTAAFSGGVLWIPGNSLAARAGLCDSRDASETYLKSEAGNHYRQDMVEAFLDHGPEMVTFLERETETRFTLSAYPDYHAEALGGAVVGRSITATPYDGRRLGAEFARLRRPLQTITFIGMMFNSSSADIKHFFNVTRSPASALYVARRLMRHVWQLLRYRRGVELTAGNALAARLARSAFDAGIPIFTGANVNSLMTSGGAVHGVTLTHAGKRATIRARRGVVLASGGFAQEPARFASVYPHVARGGVHVSPVPLGNSGDGMRMAERVGGRFDASLPNAAAWMPVSLVPSGKGRPGVFPHLVDRYKPGFIMVTRNGKRFTNEANSYHDVGRAMQEACAGDNETVAWLIGDHATIRKYGIGFVKPAPVPLFPYLRSGYLLRGKTVGALARAAGIVPEALEATVTRFNDGAAQGEDREFGRGEKAFNRYLGDPEHKPNPCVAPISKGPFYAVRIVMGDLGTFDGIVTDARARVLDQAGVPIPGLYAAGNDAASMMGGAYPGAGITLGPAMTFGYIAARDAAFGPGDAAKDKRRADAGPT